MDGFSKPPLAGLQRKVTHAREEALHKAATAAARPDSKMQAFLEQKLHMYKDERRSMVRRT